MSFDLTKVDVEHMLRSLQVRNLTHQGKEWVFSCPFSGHEQGDLRPSAAMNEHNTAWNCFSCKRRGNAITFVAEFEAVNYMTARRMLREAYGGGFLEPIGGDLLNEIEQYWNGASLERERTLPNPVLHPDYEYLRQYRTDWTSPSPWQEYMLGRGFDADTLNRYDIGFCRASNRVTLPIRNMFGYLVGFKGRAIYPDQQPKYMVLGDTARTQRYGYPVYSASQELYLIESARPPQGEPLIVCEGELNALRLRQYGYPWTAAISGSTMSSTQADLIAWTAEQAILYFDSDLAGVEGTLQAIELLQDRITLSLVPHHLKDPAASTREEVEQLLSNRLSAYHTYNFDPNFFTPIS